MSGRGSPPDDPPGTLTSLVNEVFRGSPGGSRSPWVEELAPGSALGRYDLIREVGRGGFGVVWEARDRELGRRVAVKVVRAEASDVPGQRRLAEAEVAARLSHPNVVTLLDLGRGEKAAWLVQEFLEGRTLAARISEGALPVREAVRIAEAIAAGLAHAHAHGVVHRDLTPSNVFLCDDGQVKLLDLGLAHAFGRRAPDGGTPEYAAPEQAAGAPEDERVDVYSLGVTIHRMVAGRDPFDGAPAEARPRAPRLEAQEAPGFGDLVDRMLSPDPRDRPRDARAVLAELRAIEASLPRSGPTRGSAVRVRRRWPRWASWVSAASALALAALGGALAMARWSAPIGAPVSFSPSSLPAGCNWGRATWVELDRLPSGAFLRHSRIGGQGVAEVGGRSAWKQSSDWNQLVLPLDTAARGDPFAIEAEFFIPPLAGWERGVHLGVFTDPVGGAATGEVAHGVHFQLGETPGQAPSFFWSTADVVSGKARSGAGSYIGTRLESATGRWHVIRIEGSPSQGWFRALLDGVALVVAQGAYDLSGSHVILGSGYGYTNPVDVGWSNLRTMSGTTGCR